MAWIIGLLVTYACWRAVLAWAIYRLDRRAADRGWPMDYAELDAYYRLEQNEENASPEILAAGVALSELEEFSSKAESSNGCWEEYFEKMEPLRARRDRGEIEEEAFQREWSILDAKIDEAIKKTTAEMEESTKCLEALISASKTKNYDALESFRDEMETPVDFLNDDIPDGAPPLSEEWRTGIADVLARHAHIVLHFDRAASIGAARYPIDFSKWPDSCGVLFDAWTPLKTGVRLLQRTAILRAEEGDVDGAVRALEKVFRLAQTLERQPTVMSQMVWMALVACGLKAIPFLFSRCTLKSSHLAVLEGVLDRVSQHDAYSMAWAGERCILRPVFRLKSLRTEGPAEISWRHDPAPVSEGESIGHDQEASSLSSEGANEPFRWYEWLLLELPYNLAGLETLDCLQFMTEIEEGLRVANSSPDRKSDWMRQRASEKRRFRFPLIGSLNVTIKPMPYLAIVIAMENRIANVRGALVVERFRIEHERLPQSICEIEKEMPLDIYTGAPFRYRVLGNGYVVSSAGTNGKDGGGEGGNWRGQADVTFRVIRSHRDTSA